MELAGSGLFTDLRSHVFHAAISYPTPRYLALVETFSAYRMLPPARRSEMRHELARLLDEHGGAIEYDLANVTILAGRSSMIQSSWRTLRGMREPTCVGAFVRDDQNRVFVHRRTPDRRLLPGTWDIVGGHLEMGETPEQALARELAEETGWRLRHVEAMVADWEWEYDGVVRRELDYLVDVDGDLATPRLEVGKHDAYTWVGLDNLELMMEGRTDDDRRLRDLVAKAVRTRLTDRLRLEPVGAEHADDLWRLHHDQAVAAWHGGRYTFEAAYRRAASGRRAWEKEGVDKWMAYDRTSSALVGRGGLSYTELDGQRQLEMGWTVRSDRWSRGYATEIGRAGLAFAFGELGAGSVIAFTLPHNLRSRGVMDRLGMRYLRDVIRDGARLLLYAITRASAREARTSGASPRGSTWQGVGR